jgi:hypothetical protein
MPDLIIQLIIVMIICGFIYWVYLKLIPLAPIAEPFKSILNVLVVILIGAIIIFYVVIPILRMLPRVLHG